MYKAKTLMAVTLLAGVASVPTSAQSLEKRHQIELRMGGWSQVTDTRTEIGASGVTTTVGSNGFIGGEIDVWRAVQAVRGGGCRNTHREP